MKRAAIVLSWTLLGGATVLTLLLFGSQPNLIGPHSLLPLLPFATALFAFHRPAPRWFIWLAVALNALWALAGLVILFVGAVAPLWTVLIGFLSCLLPGVLNILALSRELRSHAQPTVAS